ncbi:hypothetical protein CMO96_02270, partial [Candidatus Woesebacteria bacterium]|nr:hypothetical protein [Candidatus Woesebacteria bacterium]
MRKRQKGRRKSRINIWREKYQILRKVKRIILDIGVGRFPHPMGNEQRKIGKNEIYVGIDTDSKVVKEASEVVGQRDEKGRKYIGEGKGFILLARGQKSPFRDESVNEVVIANVIGHRLIGGSPERETLPENIQSIAQETSRVLKTGRVLNV